VLEQLQAYFPDVAVRYWRDKTGREVDFVIERRRDEVDIIECKWDQSTFDAGALQTFRSYYPHGRNYLVVPSASPSYIRRFGQHEVVVCEPSELRGV